MRIVFAGTPEFAAEHLKALLASQHDIIAVYTQPDRPAGRGQKLMPSPVKQLALEHGIAVYQPASLRNAEAQAELAALQPIDEMPGSAELPASPAVAIWDREGQLAYFGPYSEGLVCNSSNSFIEPILEALEAGRKVDASNTLAVGCFCEWAETSND